MANVLKSTQQGALTIQLLKKLDIKPQPLFRPNGVPIKPLTLFQKMGVGQLDLYILTPGKNSQEYQTFMQNCPDTVSSASKSQSLPLTALASVCALLVWHPACPQEKVVRVLFPGVTPQAKLLQGLEKLKGLAFLQKPTVTTGEFELLGKEKKNHRAESQDSIKSLGKEMARKQGKEQAKDEAKEKSKVLNGVGADKTKKEPTMKQKTTLTDKNAPKKRGGKSKEESGSHKEENGVIGKKDTALSKPKTDNKTKLKKEANNDSKTTAKKTRKPSGKETSSGKKADAELLNNNSTKVTILKPEGNTTEQKNLKHEEKNPDEKPSCSKLTPPEDMTEDFLRLQEETERAATQVETADDAKQPGNVNSSGSLSKEASIENADKANSDVTSCPVKEKSGETVDTVKPAKVVGFPCPLKNDQTIQLDLTPTEYTLLDGALRHSPPSKSSPENQAPVSLDEETVEQASQDSRPNSAGHTPYCLSPDDVWGNRNTLNRLQMGSLESSDGNEANGSPKQSNEQHSQPKNNKEKQLSFLPLGTLKEGASDPSPSLTTTTTTHSMPAEVGSPQSTEVDESLSMSFEQGPANVSQREGDDSGHHSNGGHFVGLPLQIKKPPRTLGSDMSRPPNTLHFETSPHDVDLCLVSPCEFKHFKAPDSASNSEPLKGLHHHSNNNNHKDASPSESNAPVCTEDCPSTTADGVLDSDEDESCSEPTNSPRELRPGQPLPQDPLPVPLRDSPPLPPHPDTSMPIPQSESDAQTKRAKTGSMKGKKSGVSLPALLTQRSSF